MQILFVFLAAALGLAYGHNFDGFVFHQNICLFAGLTMIMPSLFNVKYKDVGLVLKHPGLMIKNFGMNFVLFPLIALGIGLVSKDFGIAAGIFLLSVLGGGGMVMHWIKKSGGDSSMGFLILLINLLLVSLSMLMLHLFGLYTSGYFEQNYENVVNMKNFAKAVIILLIIVPFVASRAVLFVPRLKALIEANRKYISNVSIFIIVFYLFGLQKSQMLFDVYDFEPELIPTAVGAVLSFYTAVLFISRWSYDLSIPQEKAAFWHSITRYITLALVIATFSSTTFGISMLLPLMIAYVVQIPLAIYTDKKITQAGALPS